MHRILLPILLLILIVITSTTAAAAPLLQWSPQQPIPGFEDERPPIMVADQAGTVHAFNSQFIAEFTTGILYRRWTPDGGWTRPVDILIPGLAPKSALQDVKLDEQGKFHLVYYVGTDLGGDIYYSEAWAVDAAQAQEWAKPVNIGERAGPIAQASLTLMNDSDFVVLFTGKKTGTGIYMTVSRDAGKTWSETKLLVPVPGKGRLPTSINTAVDESGRLHVVWSVVNERGLGEEVFYSRLEADYQTWSRPERLALKEGNDYSTNWPTIAYHDGKLIVIYQDSFPATRFMRISTDLGETWSKPVRPFPHIGEYEHAVMIPDGSGTLHLLMGNRIGNPEIHGMWHSTLSGDQWQPLEPVVTGPLTSQFDPSAPQVAVVNGNVLIVAWWNNVTAAEFPYYSYETLDIPASPHVPLPTPPATETPTPVETDPAAVGTQTPTQLPASSENWNDAATSNNPDNPMFALGFGLLPVLVILVGFLLFHKTNTHR